VAVPLFELARSRTTLDEDQLRHVQRLVASWQPLADLCFSDLLLLAPTDPDSERGFVVLAHVRPTTGQTLYPSDLVGTVVDEADRSLVKRAWRTGDVCSGDATALGSRERLRIECIPVRCGDEVIGVVSREASTRSGRRLGELERVYLEVFDRFARMVAEGTFPFESQDAESEDAPRVGDGAIVLDADGGVRFASPNAVSALHRMGIHAHPRGLSLAAVGLDPRALDKASRKRHPVTYELERGDTSVLVHTMPLIERGAVTGAVVRMRDVTDLRRRDRMLVSKDATIREIHHRVKNNLQTIAALLRLQGRRVRSPEAQAAIEESERRVRAIAIVHETLSRDTGDVVSFDEIIRPLVRIAEETASSDALRLRFSVEGGLGSLAGDTATPLAVALNELMQNAVEHAFPLDRRSEGNVTIRLERDADQIVVTVADDGVGLPERFSLDSAKGLGLSIVQTLVTGELGGTLEVDAGHPGTRATITIPTTRS